MRRHRRWNLIIKELFDPKGTEMRIKRDDLLKELRIVEGGISDKETVEQSNCFVFQKDMVMTHNDEVACQTKCCLPITGAVNAKMLLKTLATWPYEYIEFKSTKNKLRFRGKDAKGALRMESQILLPISKIGIPKKWKKLPKEFQESIKLVGGCVSKNSAAPHLCCINFLPDWMEACDGVQAGRLTIKLPFKESTLIKRDSLRWVQNASVTAVGMTKNWVHFKNKDGLIISCRKFIEDYPTDKLTVIFKTKGVPAKLPKELKDVVGRLDYYLDDSAVTQWLIVEIDKDHIEITGSGNSGKQTITKKAKYKGEAIGFNINPSLLRELGREHDKCRISKNIIKIEKDNFQYITSLWVKKDEEEKE